MNSLIFAVLLAQIIPFPGSVAPTVATSSYSGPGDVISGAFAWWGLRAYSAAAASTKAANVCNAGDAVCADVNTLANGNFDVATATGAPLNCGGSGGTCTIKILYDQTLNGWDIVQATAALRPTLTFNAVGALPGMTFSRSASSSLLKAGSNYNGYPLSASTVAKRTGSFTSLSDVMSCGNNVQLGFAAGADSAALVSGPVSTAAAADNMIHSMQAVFTDPGAVLAVDGVSSPAVAFNGFSNRVGLGFNADGNNGLDGVVFEAGWWGSNITSFFVAINTNQHAYWGF